MKLLRIGDKLVSHDRLISLISEILKRRAIGATQQEVASALGVERSFVSHLEGLGEIRRGKRIALVGFPIANKAEVIKLAEAYGVEFVYLLSEKERRRLAREWTGARIFDEVLEVLAKLKDFDLVIFMASDKRIETLQKILGREILGLPIGRSPIRRSRKVNTDLLKKMLENITKGTERKDENNSQRKFRLFQKRSRSRSRAIGQKI
jgi:transcriptional regulator with XRE-family HTH domain